VTPKEAFAQQEISHSGISSENILISEIYILPLN
jgi:hypothetical protein